MERFLFWAFPYVHYICSRYSKLKSDQNVAKCVIIALMALLLLALLGWYLVKRQEESPVMVAVNIEGGSLAVLNL